MELCQSGVAVALVAVALVAYFITGTKSAARAQVTTGTVQRGSVLSTVSASGNVQPAQTITLNFTGTGTLVAVNVKPGQHVRKGQVLGRLDDTSETAAVRTARAGLASAEANLRPSSSP